MKKNFSLGGVVLGLLAATLAGCADEQATKTAETKSAITSRGFVTNGCTGTGVFDINSNNLINFVAIDQSNFSDVNAKLFALDKNNQEQMIASTQSSTAISDSLATLLNEVSNFTSAEQKIQIVGPDAFVNSGVFSFTVQAGQARPTVNARFTQVYQRQGDGSWKIVTEHMSMPPTPVPATPPAR